MHDQKMTDRMLFLLGLARKAGAVRSGEEGCLAAIRSREAYLVIISEDASDGTSKKFHDKVRLGHAMGVSPRSCMAIINEGLAELIQKEFKTCTEEVENIG